MKAAMKATMKAGLKTTLNPTPDTAHASPCIATAMRKASRHLTQLYDEAFKALPIRSTQYAILQEIERQPGVSRTMVALAQALVMDRSALGHNLRPLERDGLIALQPGATDRRQRCVILTPAGKALMRQAATQWQLAHNRFIALYGEQQTAQLRTALLGIAYDPRLESLQQETDQDALSGT